MPTGNLFDWVSLNLLPGLGPISHHRALERWGDPGEIAYRLPARALQSLPRMSGKRLEALLSARRALRRRAEREMRLAEKLGLRLVPWGDPAYPAALVDLPDPPILLYLRGNLPEGVARIAVIGSRRATLYGQRVATGLGQGLAARGVELVSGGARGIDTCAHVGALQDGGRTVAVLGSGFSHIYPEENEELFERISESGAVLSEFPLDCTPRRENFPRRNRVISGLGAAVVVVEATRRSGSLVTAGHALEQGREVLAVPGPVSSDRSEGCHLLIQQGAKLVQSVEDIVEELSPIYRGAMHQPAPVQSDGPERISGLLPDEEVVLGMLDTVEPLQLDDLAQRAPFSFARLQTALFALEARGAIDSHPGCYYQRKSAGSLT